MNMQTRTAPTSRWRKVGKWTLIALGSIVGLIVGVAILSALHDWMAYSDTGRKIANDPIYFVIVVLIYGFIKVESAIKKVGERICETIQEQR